MMESGNRHTTDTPRHDCRDCSAVQEQPISKLPAKWRKWSARPDAAPWIYDVWECTTCGTPWHAFYHQSEMVYCDIISVSNELLPLLKIDTSWRDAWELRESDHPFVPKYLSLFLERASLPWKEAVNAALELAKGAVDEVLRLEYLRALFANHRAALHGQVDSISCRELFARGRQFKPQGSGDPESSKAWMLFERDGARLCERLERMEQAKTAEAAKAEEDSRREPLVFTSPSAGTERVFGPEPAESLQVDRASAKELFRGALEHLVSSPLAFAAPSILTLIALETLAPQILGGSGIFSGVLLLPICLLYYAAAASVAAKRWRVPTWKLWSDRFSMAFSVWAAVALALPAFLVLLIAAALLFPNEVPSALGERLLWYAAFLLPQLRLWPVIVVPFVYRGYLYFEYPDAGGNNVAWIGPGFRTAWRITGQPGFTRRVTAPLAAAVIILLTLLELSSWAWWMRGLIYFGFLPLAVQYADQAVERWRIQCEDPHFNR